MENEMHFAIQYEALKGITTENILELTNKTDLYQLRKTGEQIPGVFKVRVFKQE